MNLLKSFCSSITEFAHFVDDAELFESKLLEYKSIKEVNGHTPMEVTIGCILGIFIGLAYSFL